MKPIPALVLLAVPGFALAACPVAVGRDRLGLTGTPVSSSSLGEIQLTRLRNGSVTVTHASR